MAAPVYLGEGVAAHGRDPSFTEAISQRMRVPNRLRVGVGLQIEEDRHRPEDLPPAYSMHIPERLALTGGHFLLLCSRYQSQALVLETELRLHQLCVGLASRSLGQRFSIPTRTIAALNKPQPVLCPQVLKLSRRLAALERQNAERRQTELVLFSLLVSTCLVNVWLWMRR
uniref:Mitochondrial fission factor n=1 Tax=Denticeps clupeoides TaxID=299321 RepID=A0AAY4EA49_9TELE